MMKLVSFCALILFSLVGFSADANSSKGKVIIPKFSAEYFELLGAKPENLGADGVLRFTPKNDYWNWIVRTKSGALKNGKQYEVEFDVRVLGDFAKDKAMEFVVRSAHGYKQWGDICQVQRYKSPSGDFEPVKVRFNLPANDEDYRIIFHARKTPVEIKNIVVKEICDNKEILIANNPKESKTDLGVLPTGAKEFDVDEPRVEKPLVVNAHDFGLSQDSEQNATALRKAIEHCKKIGATKLTMKKGVYKCFENNAGTEFVNMKDFTFDGNGSTFIFRRKECNASFWIDNCERLKLYNFDVDWDWDTDPLASLVKIIGHGKDEKEGAFYDVEFTEFENDTHPKYEKPIRIAEMSPYDIVKKAVGHENGQEAGYGFLEYHKGPKSMWIDKNKLRVFAPINSMKVGNHYRMQHWYYHSDCFRFQNNKHLTFRKINVRSTRGAAFYGFPDNQYIQIVNCKIKPKKLFRRPQTCTADHFYITNPKGNLKVENCEFSRGGDDCINFHGPNTFAQKVDDYTVRMVTTKGAYLFSKDREVELYDGKILPLNVKMKIKELRHKNGQYEIVFYDKLPEERNGGFTIFIPEYSKGNVIIRNSKFHSNRARGLLLLMGDVTVENCHIYDVEMASVRLETGYSMSWSEGTFTNNVVFRNCVLEANNSTGTTQNDGFESDIVMGAYMISYHSGEYADGFVVNNALFENNTFINTFGLVARIISSNNVIFRNNKFINTKPREFEKDYRACFYVRNSKNIKIVDNVWEESPYVKAPRVIYDTANTSNIVVEGNKIVSAKK